MANEVDRHHEQRRERNQLERLPAHRFTIDQRLPRIIHRHHSQTNGLRMAGLTSMCRQAPQQSARRRNQFDTWYS